MGPRRLLGVSVSHLYRHLVRFDRLIPANRSQFARIDVRQGRERAGMREGEGEMSVFTPGRVGGGSCVTLPLIASSTIDSIRSIT